MNKKNPNEILYLGSLGGAAVWRLSLAQGTILETRDRVPHRAPGAAVSYTHLRAHETRV